MKIITARRCAKRGICRRRVYVCVSVYVYVCLDNKPSLKVASRHFQGGFVVHRLGLAGCARMRSVDGVLIAPREGQ